MNDIKEKIYDIAKNLQLMNCSTVTEGGRPWVRYVVGKADSNLVFRFCTHSETRKVSQIRKNPHVHLSLGVLDMKKAHHWVQVEGTAIISRDRDERHAFWFDQLKNHFSGPDDPSYVIVIVKPSLIEFGTMGSRVPEIWLADEIVLGYKHLHFVFEPVFIIREDSLYYKDKIIRWDNIEEVKINEGVASYYGYGPRSLLRGPRTIIVLKTGEEITIQCDLTKETTEIRFRITQLSDDYKWLRDFILDHISNIPDIKITRS